MSNPHVKTATVSRVFFEQLRSLVVQIDPDTPQVVLLAMSENGIALDVPDDSPIGIKGPSLVVHVEASDRCVHAFGGVRCEQPNGHAGNHTATWPAEPPPPLAKA